MTPLTTFQWVSEYIFLLLKLHWPRPAECSPHTDYIQSFSWLVLTYICYGSVRDWQSPTDTSTTRVQIKVSRQAVLFVISIEVIIFTNLLHCGHLRTRLYNHFDSELLCNAPISLSDKDKWGVPIVVLCQIVDIVTVTMTQTATSQAGLVLKIIYGGVWLDQTTRQLPSDSYSNIAKFCFVHDIIFF